MEIISDVLLLARAETYKTKIMYRANLSHEQTGDYLGLLTNAGLLEQVVNGKDTLYRVTERGRKFIEYYNALAALLGEQARETPAKKYLRCYEDGDV